MILYNSKSVLVASNASLRWLYNVSSVYLVQVSVLLSCRLYWYGGVTVLLPGKVIWK
jgi:hypothetical protein